MSQEVSAKKSGNVLQNQLVKGGNSPDRPGYFSGYLSGGFSGLKTDMPEPNFNIMLFLWDHLILNVPQICLLVDSPSEDAGYRRCLALKRRGLLERIQLFPPGPGRPEYMYFLSSKGIQYVRSFTMNKGRHRPTRINSTASLVHVKHLNAFGTSLICACRETGIVLNRFVPEFAPGLDRGRKATSVEVINPHSKKKTKLIPDAVFSIEGCKSRRVYAVEIDLATGKIQSRTYKSFMGQVLKYIWCRQSRVFKEYEEYLGHRIEDFQVLYVTTNPGRAERYRKALSDWGDILRFVQFTTFDNVVPNKVLGKIWRSSSVTDPNHYSIID